MRLGRSSYLGIILRGVHEALDDLVNFVAFVRETASIVLFDGTRQLLLRLFLKQKYPQAPRSRYVLLYKARQFSEPELLKNSEQEFTVSQFRHRFHSRSPISPVEAEIDQ